MIVKYRFKPYLHDNNAFHSDIIFMVHTEIFEWNLMTFPWPFKDLFKQ